MRRSARAAGVLSLCLFSAAFMPAPLSRVDACGPPPPLRLLLPYAGRILLVGPVSLDRHGVPSDPGGPLSEASRAKLRVLETWRGEPGPFGPIPVADGDEDGNGAFLLVLAKDEDGDAASLDRIPLIHGMLLFRKEAPRLREAFRRAEALSGGEDEAVDPQLLRAHVLESLRHRVTREDAALEVLYARSSRDRSPFPSLSAEEAAEIGEALLRDDVTGDDLLGLLDAVPDLDIQPVRELAARRIDEALASAEPVYWAEALAGLLERDPACISETEDPAPIEEEAAGETDGEAVAIEEAIGELEGHMTSPLELPEDLSERFEREALERWVAFKESWPGRRLALVR